MQPKAGILGRFAASIIEIGARQVGTHPVETNMSTTPAQAVPSAEAGHRRMTNEDARQFLHSHIRKTARDIKFLDLLVLLIGWIAVIFAVWLVACVVDHWLLPLPGLARWVVWLAVVAGTLAWLTLTVNSKDQPNLCC
jgi:hypothetical protein